ncbi:hypothetical protein M758_3G030100 [Ceratodon purpureus]|nr:hypothetical protein M758_3G030100 [Ceratodon purpureus]
MDHIQRASLDSLLTDFNEKLHARLLFRPRGSEIVNTRRLQGLTSPYQLRSWSLVAVRLRCDLPFHVPHAIPFFV